MNKQDQQRDVLKSLEQNIDFDKIKKSGKDMLPQPGTYIIFLLAPLMDKRKSSKIALPENILFNPNRMLEWMSYSSYHPMQGLIVAKGSDLTLPDGRKEPGSYDVDDIIYIRDVYSVGDTIIHDGMVFYMIHQRNILCSVKRDDTYSKEPQIESVKPLKPEKKE